MNQEHLQIIKKVYCSHVNVVLHENVVIPGRATMSNVAAIKRKMNSVVPLKVTDV